MNAALKAPMSWLTFWRWNVAFVLIALIANGNWFAYANNQLPASIVLLLAVWGPLLLASAATGLQVLFLTPQPLALWRNIFVQLFGVFVILGWLLGWIVARMHS